MDSQPEQNHQRKAYHRHHCPRHSDLTILINTAKKDICNSCFATLKKSYFNVIAGILLEEHYLHNVCGGLIKQNTIIQNTLTAQEQAILRLQAEITEIKNNGGSHEPQNTKPTNQTIPNPTPLDTQHKTSNAQEICTKGHVAQVAHSLQDLLHIKIARVLDKWKKKKATITPKTDDLQDTSTNTPTPQR